MLTLAKNRKIMAVAAFAAVTVGLGIGQAFLQRQAEAQGESVQAPRFEVDPLWPKPLPNNWLLGWTIGVWVDEQDYVWIIHRGASGLNKNEIGAEVSPPIAECCRTAPPVLVFDPDGNVVRAWGGPGPGYEWPQSNHGIHVDYKGNPPGQDLGRSKNQRGLCRGRLSQQARRGYRRGYGQDEALLGRLRQQAGRYQSRPLRSQSATGATVSQPRSLH